MELTSEEAPTEEVRKSEEFDRRNIRRVTRKRKVSRSSSLMTDSSTETEDFVEEALAVEELAEATALGPKGDNAELIESTFVSTPGKRGASRFCLRHYPCDECSFNAENSSELKKHF